MKKNYIFSILMLVLSVSACAFFAYPKSYIEVSAAAASDQISCYTMLSGSEDTYQANVAVGTVSGGGKFVVGSDSKTITATAKPNFQLVGWKVTYNEQSNITEFFDTTGEITLMDKDGKSISATLNYENYGTSSYHQSGTFTISRIFEDLTITPVFDHIYYNVDISNLMDVSTFNNSVSIGSNTLFYKQEETDQTITTYEQAYLFNSTLAKRYYCGNVKYDGTNYYTVHSQLTEAQGEEKVDLSRGAFRVGDIVDINFEVNKNGKKIDLQTVKVDGSSLSLTNEEVQTNQFKITKDTTLKTVSYQLKFDVRNNENYNNKVELNYHELYLVDLNFYVDETAVSDDSTEKEILGTDSIFDEASNVKIYNYYSVIDNTALKFYIKHPSNNGGNKFQITSTDKISKSIDGTIYDYYNFVSINNTQKTTVTISPETDIDNLPIKYTSIEYKISFGVKEFDATTETLEDLNFSIAIKEELMKKRGFSEGFAYTDEIDYDYTGIINTVPVGYKFKGLSTDGENILNITKITVSIANDKPTDQMVYVVIEKIEYKVRFTNFNKKELNGNHALISVTFSGPTGSETLDTFAGEFIDLDLTLKLGDTMSITPEVAQGFVVLGFNAKNLTDYFNEFTLNEDFISNKSDIIVDNGNYFIKIYVYEDYQYYTLSYFITAADDPFVDSGVIMANIGLDGSSVKAEKYKLVDEEYVLIEEGDSSPVDKLQITVSDLKFNDVITLNSEGKALGYAEGNYIFKYFTKDEGVANRGDLDEGNPTGNWRTTIKGDTSIQVVYSIPQTSIEFKLSEDSAILDSYSIKLEQDNTEVEANNGIYVVSTDTTIKITLSDITFGYNFVGYYVNEEDLTDENDLIIEDYNVRPGNNIIQLKFTHINYTLKFIQKYDTGEEYGTINESVTVDNFELDITKPEGYYVSDVTFGSVKDASLSAGLRESNDFKSNANKGTFQFNKLNKDQFIYLVTPSNGIVENGSDITLIVNLTYSVYKYQVSVDFSLTNSKSLDSNINYPEYTLRYTYKGKEKITSFKDRTKVVTIETIPHGATNLIFYTDHAGVTGGIAIVGWTFASGAGIPTENYLYDNDSITILSVTEDVSFKYKHKYIDYNVKFDYKEGSNSPVFDNDRGDGKQTIQALDKFTISIEEQRSTGYKITSVGYMEKFAYHDETWEEDKENINLYTKEEGNSTFTKVDDPTRENANSYYVYKILTNSNKFEDSKFNVNNYYIDESNNIYFKVMYEVLTFKITNTVTVSGWADLEDEDAFGIEDRIKIPKSEIATISITATNNNDSISREIDENSILNFGETLTITFSINQNARAKYYSDSGVIDKYYNLTRGLTLSGVSYIAFTSTNETTIVIELTISDLISKLGNSEIIAMEYTLTANTKSVYATTFIEYESFYGYVEMTIAPKDFSGGTSDSNGNKFVTYGDKRFLTKATASANIVPSQASNLNIIGYEVYLVTKVTEVDDGLGNTKTTSVIGKEISIANYALYGIEPVVDNGVVIPNQVVVSLEVELLVKFKVSAKITTKGNKTNFELTYQCDASGNGISQTEEEVTIGTDEDCYIQIPELLEGKIDITYKQNKLKVNPINCGEYKIELSINTTESWFEELILPDNLTLTIKKKVLTVTYDSGALNEEIKKNGPIQTEYCGDCKIALKDFMDYLIITDGSGLVIKYSEIEQGNHNFELKGGEIFTTTFGYDERTNNASETLYHILYRGFTLNENIDFNKNFELYKIDNETTQVRLDNCVKINKKSIEFDEAFKINNKVFDGTTDATIAEIGTIKLDQIIAMDQNKIKFDASLVEVRFSDSKAGSNKQVIIDVSKALTGGAEGDASGNYTISHAALEGLTIYPDSLSAVVEGFGEVKILNIRGKTEYDKVGLIPLNSKLVVQPVYADSVEYANLYKTISKHLKGNKEFVVGYNIYINENGVNRPVNNQLHLSVPYVKDLLGMYFLSNDVTGELTFTEEGGYYIIDLSQMDSDFTGLFSTKKRILLKPWQIVLIVITSVLVVAAVVLAFIVVRKRKNRVYEVHETI